jgi:hypothetical protein
MGLPQEKKIQVQVKDPINNKSLSFTVKNLSLDVLYHRLLFTCKMLENNPDNDVKIVHYNTKNREEIIHEEEQKTI